MTRPGVALLLAGTLVMSACSAELNPNTAPACDADVPGGVATATIMQLQAIPDAAWGPCINELAVGWDYSPQVAQRGETTFWLDSDRMGDEFLEVRLQTTCEHPGAIAAASPLEGIDRYVHVQEQPGAIKISLIPVAPRHEAFASGLAAGLSGRRIEGRSVETELAGPDEGAPARIQRALTEGRYALVIDDREMTSNTIELRFPGGHTIEGVSLDKALEEVGDEMGTPRFRATWFHDFTGGCIVYRFDATGAGAQTVADDVADTLGFFPLAELRSAGRDAGFDI